MANTAKDVLSKARTQIGYSRWTDPQQGTIYGRWYAQSHGSYYGVNGVPYCAMFVSWVFAQVGASCAGLPEAYCPYILNKARNAGKIIPDKRNAFPGDVILFDWGNDGICDHVGIVEKNFGSYVQTIEGNTSTGSSVSQSNGGVVARRTRSWRTVKAVIRPNYGSGSSVQAPSIPPASTSSHIIVDGYIGVNSIKLWQSQLKTTADGVISGQYKGNKKYLERLTSVTWTVSGSAMVMALQRKLNAYGNYQLAVDGFMGYNTVVALQKWLRSRCGYVRHAIDGYLGPDTAANIQNALNAGFFK